MKCFSSFEKALIFGIFVHITSLILGVPFIIWLYSTPVKIAPIQLVNSIWENRIEVKACLNSSVPKKTTLLLSHCGGVYEEHCEVLNSNKRLYASIQGYHFLDETIDFPTNRALQWMKIALILHALKTHPEQIIIWFDADVIVADPSVSIFKVVPQISDNKIVFSKDHGGINSGTILIQNNAESLEFFQRVWDLWYDREYRKRQGLITDSLDKFAFWEQSAIVEISRSYPVLVLPFMPFHTRCQDRPVWSGKSGARCMCCMVVSFPNRLSYAIV